MLADRQIIQDYRLHAFNGDAMLKREAAQIDEKESVVKHLALVKISGESRFGVLIICYVQRVAVAPSESQSRFVYAVVS